MNKKDIRKLFREKRDMLSGDETEQRSEEICKRILELPEYEEADAVLCYMAFRNEVNLKNVMLTAWLSGKKVFLPRMDGKEMEFFLVKEEDRLILNDTGIEEPDRSAGVLSEYIYPGQKLLMIVPGVVFDRYGYRLGYGGGYYDRYLAANRDRYEIKTAAAAFSIQLYEGRLPVEEFDAAVDMVVTEESVIRC